MTESIHKHDPGSAAREAFIQLMQWSDHWATLLSRYGFEAREIMEFLSTVAVNHLSQSIYAQFASGRLSAEDKADAAALLRLFADKIESNDPMLAEATARSHDPSIGGAA